MSHFLCQLIPEWRRTKISAISFLILQIPTMRFFFAGCNSIITTLEKIETVGIVEPKPNVPECNYIASGFAKRSKQMPPEAAPLAPGTTLTLTSDDSTTPCTMVESNGTAYKSHNWTSTIKVGAVKKRSGLVTVTYELFCQDGQ